MRKVAEQRKCDDEQNSIVVGTLDYARKLSLQITGATYNVDKNYKYRSDDFQQISTALGLENMCKFTTQLARQTLAILYDLVAEELSRRKQSELVSKGRELRKLSNDVSREKCNPAHTNL